MPRQPDIGRCLQGAVAPRARPPHHGLDLARPVWLGAWLVAAMLGVARAEDAGPAPDAVAPTDPAAVAPARPERARTPRTPGAGRSPMGGTAGRSPGLDGSWTGMACLALLLAGGGGVAVALRRFGPRAASAGAVQVVGRVSLSPKHSVYLLRVDRRVMVIGTGPQGPPSLIAELDELPGDVPTKTRPEVES